MASQTQQRQQHGGKGQQGGGKPAPEVTTDADTQKQMMQEAEEAKAAATAAQEASTATSEEVAGLRSDISDLKGLIETRQETAVHSGPVEPARTPEQKAKEAEEAAKSLVQRGWTRIKRAPRAVFAELKPGRPNRDHIKGAIIGNAITWGGAYVGSQISDTVSDRLCDAFSQEIQVDVDIETAATPA